MSAPPLFRLADERRVSVVRDAAIVRRALDLDPVGSCMVASRVADHGIDPAAIGGEMWTRNRPDESLCFAGANLIPLRGEVADLNAFADKATSSVRRCSSLVAPSWCCRCGVGSKMLGALRVTCVSTSR
jgi:predicted GNAT family acetyltransferase